MQALKLSPDGMSLASCGDDGAIVVWDMHNGEQIQMLRRDRPYERLDITGIKGLSDAQKASLRALGAVERPADTAMPIRAPAHADTSQRNRSGTHPASTLPLQPTSFVGRDEELSAIVRILANPSCRLLTLIGPGGMGKTRLALEIAAAQRAVFADGVVFVALASVGSPNQIVSALGEALGLAFTEHPDPRAHLLAFLRERHMLLILDNLEHLLDGVDLVSEILVNAPRVTILATSSERLNVRAEWLFDVGGLAYPPKEPAGADPAELLTELTSYSAIELFVQRAIQVQPALMLDRPMLLTIVRICQYVAGIPLAIELAAAGVRTLPLAEIERHITANLDALVTTLRDVPPRHRSLRAVFDYSWRLLEEYERVLFSRLSVFRGGWSLAAAAEVTGATLPVLNMLVDKSLVRQSGDPSGREPRFTLLEPLREYAREQLIAQGEAAAIQRAHARYYQSVAEAVAAQWGTATFELAIAQLQREYDNMRVALAWARDSSDSLLGLQLAEALWQFWRSYGYISEGRTWLDQLLALDSTPTDPIARSARQYGLHAAAWLASDQHDYTQAAQFFVASMALRQIDDHTAGETDQLLNAARQARALGDYPRAIALANQALAWHRAQGHGASHVATLTPVLHAFGQALRELGLFTREQGDYVRARMLFDESLTFHQTFGDRACVALALIGLADVARDQGDAQHVRVHGEAALAILRELGMQWAIGFTLNTLALGAYYTGNLGRARTLIRESEALFRSLDAGGSLAEILITVGKIEHALGDTTAAYDALTKALRFAQATGPRVFVAASLEGLACAGKLIKPRTT